MTFGGTSNKYGYRGLGGIHGGVSVVGDGAFELGWCHTLFRSW